MLNISKKISIHQKQKWNLPLGALETLASQSFQKTIDCLDLLESKHSIDRLRIRNAFPFKKSISLKHFIPICIIEIVIRLKLEIKD